MKRVISAGIAILFVLTSCLNARAENQPTLIKGFATAYIGESDTTCTGDKVREGICGGCQAYIGKTIILYQRLPGDKIGQIIGIYECLDTGTGTEGFQQGRVIDVYKPTMDACQDFMDRIYEDGCHGKVFIQVIESEG